MQMIQLIFKITYIVRRLWLARTLFLQKNWVGNEMASLKIAFYTISGCNWVHILTQRAKICNSLMSILVFNRQKETITNYVTLILSNQSKNLENNDFVLFLIRSKFCPNFLKCDISSLYWPEISTQAFLTTTCCI